MPLTAMSDVEIAHQLAALPGWSHRDGMITRAVETSSFLAAVTLLQRVALVAEAQDHHPDLTVAWRTLTVSMFTHDAKGITHRDFDLARALTPLLDSVAA